ncbi:MAG: acyltransferase family protein [Sulfurimonas sp.]|nr:acyltransferase family protein [Sulfurimonas sp.]
MNYIDFLKGFAIFLVVLGHELQTYYINFDQLYLFKLIYSFHMPLFIVISGFLANKSLKSSGCSFDKCIKKKFFYLMIPFFSWYLIGLLLKNEFPLDDFFGSLYYLLTHVDTGLWYLCILYFLYILLYVASKFNYKYIVLIIFFFIMPMTNFLGMSLLKWYLIFFIIGMLLFDQKENIAKVVHNSFGKLMYVIPFLFVPSLYYWEREFETSSIFYNHYYLYGYKFLVAILGIISVFLLTRELFKLPYVNNMFNFFGKNSMKIYILNFVIIGFVHKYSSIDYQLLLLFIYAFLICYFIVWITTLLTKIKIFKILFGENQRINN